MSKDLFEFDIDLVDNPAKAQEEPKTEEPGQEKSKPVTQAPEPEEKEVIEPEPAPKTDPGPEDEPAPPPTTTEEEEEEEETDPLSPEEVYYGFLKETAPISEIEGEVTVEKLREVQDTLPEAFFMQAVKSLHPDAQELLSLAFNLGNEATSEKLGDFFNKYNKGGIDPENITNHREFLYNEYVRQGVFQSEDDLNNFLDDLEDKSKLESYSKTLASKKIEERKEQKNKELAAQEAVRKEKEREQKEFANKIKEQLDTTGWTDARKDVVLTHLNAEKFQSINQQVRKSPKAIVQLADVYSYFDEKTGEFDFSKLVSAKAESIKALGVKKNISKDKFSTSLSRIGTTAGTESTKRKTKGKNRVIKPVAILDDNL